jgi:hypothetical protein
VICDISKRSQYGSPQDLLLISDILIKENATPFHTLFLQAIKGKGDILSKRKYQKVILLADGLDEEAIQSLRKFIPQKHLLIISQSEKGWINKLARFLGG